MSHWMALIESERNHTSKRTKARAAIRSSRHEESRRNNWVSEKIIRLDLLLALTLPYPSFNLYDEDAELIPHYVVQIRANGANISLRTGCLCNPGVGTCFCLSLDVSLFWQKRIGEFASGMSNRELGSCAIAATVASISVTRPNLKAGTNASSTKVTTELTLFQWYWHTFVQAGAFFNCMIQHGAPTGLVRVSFGIGSNFRDAYRVLEMLKEFLNPTDVKKWVAEWRASFSPPESLCWRGREDVRIKEIEFWSRNVQRRENAILNSDFVQTTRELQELLLAESRRWGRELLTGGRSSRRSYDRLVILIFFFFFFATGGV